MKNSILEKARWLREVALATSKNNGARVAHEWLKYAAMFVMLLTLGSGNAWGAAATLPVDYSFKDGKNSLPTGVTQNGLGSDYAAVNAPYRLKFDNNDDYIQIQVDAAAKTITIGVKEFGSSGASIQIQGSADGSSFTNIQTLSFSKGQNKTSSQSTSSSISSSYRYFRVKRNSGSNFGLGTLAITKVVAPCTKIDAPTVTATPGDGRIDLSWSNQTGASSYSVTKTPSGGSVGTPSKSGSTWSCAITGLMNGTTYTWSVEAVGSGDYCASDNTAASASATPNVYYTVTWKNNGSEYTTTSVASGQKPTFPSNPSSCDGTSTTFVGWTPTPWSGKLDDVSAKTIYTSGSAMPDVSGPVTYHAVFAKETSTLTPVPNTWTRITSTSQLTDGATVMLVQYYSDFAINNTPGATKCTANAEITNNSTDLRWIAVKSGSKWKFKTSGGAYLSTNALANNTNLGLNQTYDEWTISADDGGTTGSNNIYTNTNCFRLNNGSDLEYYSGVFKLYTWSLKYSSAYPFYIYIQKTTGSTTYSQYLTTCCTNNVPAPTVIATNTAYTVTLTWGAVDGATGYEVSWNGGAFEAATSPCVKSGLTASTDYIYKVRATYDPLVKCGALVASGNVTTDDVYSVTYSGGTGTGSCSPSGSVAPVSYEAGATVTLAPTNSFSLTSNRFAAWVVKDAENNDVAVSNNQFTMPASNVTVTATWTAVQDKYYDRMHQSTDASHGGIADGNGKYYIVREGCNYTVPSPADDSTGDTDCHTTHFKLLGWIAQSHLKSDGSIKDGAESHLFQGGTIKSATGATYYAIYAIMTE